MKNNIATQALNNLEGMLDGVWALETILNGFELPKNNVHEIVEAINFYGDRCKTHLLTLGSSVADMAMQTDDPVKRRELLALVAGDALPLGGVA